MHPEVIDNLLRYRSKTLRLVTSIASKTFDICGLVAPLISQVKKSVSKAIEQTSGEWDNEINDELWKLFKLQVIQIIKTSLYKYDRIQSMIDSKDKNLTLIIQSDASTSLITLGNKTKKVEWCLGYFNWHGFGFDLGVST